MLFEILLAFVCAAVVLAVGDLFLRMLPEHTFQKLQKLFGLGEISLQEMDNSYMPVLKRKTQN
jgi:hypothetical protein